MVSSSCMTIPKLLAKLKNCCKSLLQLVNLERLPCSPDLASNLGSKHLSGTRFHSDSDVQTSAENRFDGLERDFYKARLNKLVLRSNKCLNRFGDYVEK
ncbi:hypothetical protein AVEN_161391-1 [Araneus ventricosus]|uniref:Uncharacterized protein n=1 Tax=Araneus ventricosus TaxID=182803 RepID=A0A4Y2HYY7_ARAVE|nr:hypothetical protein AVEN_161391-1 [Araneus ventricosus]